MKYIDEEEKEPEEALNYIDIDTIQKPSAEKQKQLQKVLAILPIKKRK